MNWNEHLEILNQKSEDELADILCCKWKRINNLYPIINKKGDLIPFKLNKHQISLKNEIIVKGKNPIVLKSRQVGITTFFSIFDLDEALFNTGVRIALIAHKRENLGFIFNIVKTAFENLPEFIKISKDGVYNKNEIEIKENKSIISVMLEARSLSLTHVHFSEYAFTEKKRIDATIGALSPNSFISIESTPNGLNHFYKFYMDTPSNYSKFFIPWFNEPSYKTEIIEDDFKLTEKEIQLKKKHDLSNEQINFQRIKTKEIGKRMFDQEYAGDPIDCFLASGTSVLDLKNLSNQLENMKPALFDFTNMEMRVKIFENLRDKNKIYYIGVDPSEAVSRDYTGMQVLSYDKNSQEINHSASIRGYLSPIELSIFINKFTKEHFDFYPELIIERNNHGHAVLQALLFNDKSFYEGELYHSFRDSKAGFLTTKVSKKAILKELFSDIDYNNLEINCEQTISELTTLICTDSGSIESDTGKFDDMVMSLALTHHILVSYEKKNIDYNINEVNIEGLG